MTDIDETLVEVCARPPHTAFLVLHYNGKEPPRALFADLVAIGWDPPAFAPPPRAAIDWSTPDEVTGMAFTVGDYRIDDAVVEPPPGSGPRGSWTPNERQTFCAQLAAVLARHEVEVDDSGLILPSRAPAATSVGLPPPPDSPALPALAPGSTVRMRTDLTPDRLDEFAAACAPRGVIPGLVRRIETRTETFRGSQHHRQVAVLVIEVLVPSEQAGFVAAVIADFGASVTYEIVVDEALTPASPPSTAGGEAAALSGQQAFPPGTIRATLLLHPRAVPLVEEHLTELALLRHELTATTRTVTSTYRGTVQEQRQPAVRLEVWVDPEDAAAVVRILAAASGVDPDDPDLVTMEEVATAVPGPDPDAVLLIEDDPPATSMTRAPHPTSVPPPDTGSLPPPPSAALGRRISPVTS